MKRFVTFLLVAVTLFAAIAFLAGCGDNTKQAKEYMEAGDDVMKEVASMANEMSGEVTSAFADVTEPSNFSDAIKQVKEYGEEITRKADEARDEYAKILELDGVDDYTKYAELMLMDIDAIEETMSIMSNMLDKVNSAVASGAVDQLPQLQEEFSSELTRIQEKVTKAEEEANQLKKDKNL